MSLQTNTRPSTTIRLSPRKPHPILDPAFIPLPPSPPATDPLEELDPIELPKRASSSRTKVKVSENGKLKRSMEQPSGSSWPSRIRNEARVKNAINPSRKRVRDRFEPSDSPPSSPTARKSLPPSNLSPILSGKRLKPTGRSTPTPDSKRTLAYDLRDSARNPFIVRPGERPRRAGARKDDEHRKLVYVFRGKRIEYDCAEDLDGPCGDSPFSLSKPKLLFPSPPSPSPSPSKAIQSGSMTLIDPKSFQTPQKSIPNKQFFLTPMSKPRKRIDRSSNRAENSTQQQNTSKSMR
ncbi:hypothetical protein BY996DRAFT_8684613 [Phakopsora pachyrhizi]|nr:hypothetical protein BY996DRAFT_8684613 [Phakopsora pachyrhizi]